MRSQALRSGWALHQDEQRIKDAGIDFVVHKPCAVNDFQDVVEEALQLAGIDSLAARGRWVDEVPGVDLAALPPARREVFLRFANARRCTCDCGYTLAGCRNFDASCETSGPLVAALYDSVRAGFIRSASGIRERPARGG